MASESELVSANLQWGRRDHRLHDGQGERVAQQTTTGGVTTTTVYVGDVEEVSTSGSTTTATTYYYANGKRIAAGVNGTVNYVASDALGSSSVTLNGSGTATASQLFAPYGSVRYSSGTMPTSYGFTGQRNDAVTGLDYSMPAIWTPCWASSRAQTGCCKVEASTSWACHATPM